MSFDCGFTQRFTLVQRVTRLRGRGSARRLVKFQTRAMTRHDEKEGQLMLILMNCSHLFGLLIDTYDENELE